MLLESDRNRIRHMLQAAHEALAYAENRTREQLDSDRPLQHLLVRNLEVFGEAARRITPETRAALVQIPWRRIVGMRNRVIHAYFDIDLDIVWTTVNEGLPQIVPLLEAFPAEHEP